jgi:hypothetical protein
MAARFVVVQELARVRAVLPLEGVVQALAPAR